MITFASGAIFGAVAFYLALRNNAKVKAKVPSEPVPGPYVVIVGCPGQIHMKTITQKQLLASIRKPAVRPSASFSDLKKDRNRRQFRGPRLKGPDRTTQAYH